MDSGAIVCALAATLIVVVNAVFLQSGAHPAPFFANPTAVPLKIDGRWTTSIPMGMPRSPTDKPREATLAPPASTARAPQSASPRHNDPIADLIGSSAASAAHILAAQRVLSEFGYGQLRPTGVVDEPTSAAIQKFEIDRKLPVTGRVSDRLLSELAAMTGRPLE